MSHKMGSFSLRRRPILSLMVLLATMLLLNTFYVSAVETNYSNHTPAKNSTITISNLKISVYVKSTYELDSASAKIELNSEEIQAKFTYKGKWVDDYYEGRIWQILDRREGTISFDATNLKDGSNTVEVSILDKGGNTLTDTWSFIVAEPPKFNNLSPADKSEQITVNQLSAVVSENTAVYWDSVKLKINGSYVDPAKMNMNSASGAITYNFNFPSNSYTAILEAKDSSGNLGTKTWTFTADSLPPNLTGLYYFKDGSVLTDGILKFSGELTDLVDIKDNASLSLDGVPLNATFNYKGSIDYYGNYVISTRKQASIKYEGTVPNGNHTLSLYTEDKLGNKITRNWTFTMSAKPVISNETPIKYGVNNLKPTISALVKSPNGSVKADSIKLNIDGKAVAFNYDPNTGLVSYTPDTAINNESYHSVNLIVSDLSGQSISRDWKFYINTYPDMKDSEASNCTTCHPATSFSGSNGILEDSHSKSLSFGGTHSRNKCQNCHNYITQTAGCSQCHGGEVDEWTYAPHGSTPTIHYQPKNYDPYFPIRVTENRDMFDCIVCHQPGSQIKAYEGYQTTPTRLLNNHDIPELHKNTNEDAFCTKCHAQSLTREHARDDRTDKEGKAITCNTCHKSTDPKVTQAIQNKTTECSACHGEASHDSLHVNDQLSTNCTGGGCHNNTLTIEHKNRNVACSTCHGSQNPVVTTAIANRDKTCQACHTAPTHQNVHGDCATCHQNKTLDELKAFID